MDGWIKRTYIFSNGKSNSCGVAIGYIANNEALDKNLDKNWRILILDFMVDET